MAKETLKIVFETDGATSIEAIGYKGKGCQLDTKDIERALGKVIDVKLKPEHRLRQPALHNRQSVG